jgi:hypothetical protein
MPCANANGHSSWQENPAMTPLVVEPGDAWLAEAATSFQHHVPEKLVRCLWYDRRWRPSALQTLTGQSITVHDPGRWNVQAGPDFQQAAIAFDEGPRLRGDVEIHCYASGWTAHRHHLDPRYNRVILHVFLWHDRQATEVIRADGQSVPQLALAPCLPHPLAAYQSEISLEDYPYKYAPLPGHCYDVLKRLEPSQVRQFLDQAGDLRLQRRVGRWASRAMQVGLAQVMYEAVLRSLGATGFRQPFHRLAQQVLWQELRACLQEVAATGRKLAAEALLFGLTGILEQVHHTAAVMDQETQHYIKELCSFWDTFPATMRQRAWCNATWRQPHVRPANTPQRRLAAMAQLLAQYAATDLLDAALLRCQGIPESTHTTEARKLCKALTELFDVPGISYWSQRTHWGGRKGRPQRLIGAQRALTVVIDAVLPVLLLAAQEGAEAPLRERLLACYHAAPRLPDNALLRYMARRLLGADAKLLSLISGARQQQGLLQVFYDHCDNDEGDCQGCDFPRLLTS